MSLSSLFRFASRPLVLGLALAALGSTPALAATNVTCSPTCQGTWTLGMNGVDPTCTFTWSNGTSAGSPIDLGRYPTSGLGALKYTFSNAKSVPFSLSVTNCNTPLSQISVKFSGTATDVANWPSLFRLGTAADNLAFSICLGTTGTDCSVAANQIKNNVPYTLRNYTVPVVIPNGPLANFVAIALCATSACTYADTGASGASAALTVVTSYN